MISPRKLLLVVIFALAALGVSAASDIYFAQNAAGSNNGSSCANAFAYNDGSHGINVGGNWSPGNKLHICGTINANAATNVISAQGSGSSGNPITIKFENNAIVQEPYFGTSGSSGIYLSGRSFITIDGGSNGLIQATQNGTAGTSACPAGACTFQKNNTTAIEAMGSNNFTVQNLNCDNQYLQTAHDSVGGAPGIACIHFQGSNVSINNNQLHNAGIAIDNTQYKSDDNTQIFDNDFQEDGWAIGCAGAAYTNTNYQIYNNHFHNFDRWTLGGGATHVNGIHCYDGSGGGIASFYLYNNVFDGSMGTCCWTGWVYLESNGPGDNWNNNTGTVFAFNNIFVDSIGLGNASLQTGGGVNHLIVDNSFYGTLNSGTCLQWGGTGVTIQNNVFNNCGEIMFADPHSGQTPSYKAIDYNIYGKAQSGNALWHVNSMSVSSMSAWQSACNCDGHSQAQLSSLLADITPDGVPSSGFIGAQQGTDLMSMATGKLAALAYDTGAGNSHTPVSRPTGTCSTQGSSSCWEIGAYFGSGGASPQPPTGLAAVVQ